MVGVMANTLFTIEQIELIRRLRLTGITKEQVSEAFEQLERLDAEMGKPKAGMQNNMRISMQQSLSNPNCSVSSSSCNFENNTTTGQTTGDNAGNTSGSSTGLNITITKVESLPSSCHLLNGLQTTGCGSMQSGSRPQSNSSEGGMDGHNGDSSSPGGLSSPSPNSRLPSELTIIPLSSPSGQDATGGKNSSGVVPLECLVNPMDFYQDDIFNELEDLKKKNEEHILSEIRNFVMRYNIKQTMIAEMTKMSQAYVSRFFRGDTSDMSERTKNMFYTWYLTCKNNPWKLAQMCPNSGVKRMVSDSGDLIPLKRERFTFKAAHLAILERYYEKDPYPDNDTREKIMEECNKAVSKGDRFLSEKEKLTPSVVSNWFNNRRKEAKKLMRQQHAMSSSASIPQQALALPYLPSASASGWSPGMPSSINFNAAGGGQSSAAVLQQHLNAMAQSEPQLDLSCEVDDCSDNSRDSNDGHFDADHLMIMELHEESQPPPTARLINIKTET